MKNKYSIPALRRMINRIEKQNVREDCKGIRKEGEHYIICSGHHAVRLFEDVPELPHVDENLIIVKGMGLNKIVDNARNMAVDCDILPLPTAAELREFKRIRKAEGRINEFTIPYPLGDCVTYVNPDYLLDIMEGLKDGLRAYMPKNATSTIYFSANGGDAILLPVRVKGAENEKVKNEKAVYYRDCAIQAVKDKKSADTASEKRTARKPKKDNGGQPVNLAQLKKALHVGATFEIDNRRMGVYKRRHVIKATATGICSVVPFENDNKINLAGGSWLYFSKAAFWRFEEGKCSLYSTDNADEQTENTRLISLRIVEQEVGYAGRFEAWKAAFDAGIHAEKEQAEAEREAAEIAKRDESVKDVEDAIISGGDIKNTLINGEKSVFLILAGKYGISIPMRLAGWMNKTLAQIKVENGKCISVWRWKNAGGASTTIFDYLNKIIAAVCAMHEQQTAEPKIDDADTMTDEEIAHFFGEDITNVEASTEASANSDESTRDNDIISSGETTQADCFLIKNIDGQSVHFATGNRLYNTS